MGNKPPPYPRHSKQYRELYKLLEQVQAERVAGFRDYIEDVQNGIFPAREHIIEASGELIAQFVDKVDS